MKTLNLGIRKLNVKETTIMGAMIALNIILGKLSINIGNILKFSLAFIIIFLMGTWFGPIWAGIGSGISDIISSLILSTGGGYFFGFTISAILGGLFYGLFFYRSKVTVLKVIIAQLIIMLFVNLFLNTLWITILSPMPMKAIKTLVMIRLSKQIIVTPIQMISIYLLGNSKSIINLGRRYLS